jgi:hypothetical protein
MQNSAKRPISSMTVSFNMEDFMEKELNHGSQNMWPARSFCKAFAQNFLQSQNVAWITVSCNLKMTVITSLMAQKDLLSLDSRQ